VPAWYQRIVGAVLIVLSASLYGASLLLNSTFWPGLATTAILGVVGKITSSNPSSLTSVSARSKTFRWALWIATMAAGAIAGAGFVRCNFGAAGVSCSQTIRNGPGWKASSQSRWSIISDAAVLDARGQVETANVIAKADCAPGQVQGPQAAQRVGGCGPEGRGRP